MKKPEAAAVVNDKLGRLIAAVARSQKRGEKTVEERTKAEEEILTIGVEIAALVLTDLHRIADALERLAEAHA